MSHDIEKDENPTKKQHESQIDKDKSKEEIPVSFPKSTESTLLNYWTTNEGKQNNKPVEEDKLS